MRIILLISFILTLGLLQSNAQQEPEIYNHLGLNIKYGIDRPLGELNNRFGLFNEAGIGFEYFVANKNLFISAEADFLFGSSVKEDVIAPLRISNGISILGVSGSYAQVFLRMRGSYFGLMFEKLIAANEYGRGWRIGLGAGLFSHRVRVQDDLNTVPQVQNEYVKGYDHRTLGPALREKIAYNYVNNARRVFFSIGLEFTQGFTKNIRALNYDSMTSENESRLDMSVGLNIKYTLVFRNSSPAETIYY